MPANAQQKLQRRIANSRGVAPEAALVSPTRQSIEELRPDGPKFENPRVEAPPPAVVKRKYRRHPKVCRLVISSLKLRVNSSHA